MTITLSRSFVLVFRMPLIKFSIVKGVKRSGLKKSSLRANVLRLKPRPSISGISLTKSEWPNLKAPDVNSTEIEGSIL